MSSPHYHVGILVHDLDAAVARFGALLDVDFQVIVTGAEDRNLSPRIAYSLGAPPYLELIQSGGDGVHAPSLGEGIHHIGFSLEGVEGRCRDLEERAGVAIEPIFTDSSGRRSCAFTDPRDAHGVRVELVDFGVRAAFEARVGIPL